MVKLNNSIQFYTYSAESPQQSPQGALDCKVKTLQKEGETQTIKSPHLSKQLATLEMEKLPFIMKKPPA